MRRFLLAALMLGPTWAVAADAQRRTVFAYLHPNRTANADGLTSLAANANVLTHVSPCWLIVEDAKGALVAEVDPALVAFCRESGLLLVPRLEQKNFSRALVHAFLRDPKARARLVGQLVPWLLATGCHGVNLDFEYVPAADRNRLTNFVRELSAALRPHGLLLTMAVPAKMQENVKSSWSGAFDYAALGRACDLIILMAYDEHYGGGPAGPVASLPFVERVLSYATKTITRNKVLLGMPFYARDWPADGKGKARTARDALALAEISGAEVKWDERARSPWFQYLENGVTRTVWFEDFRSIAAKVLAADRTRIGGLSIWRLGNEDPAFWLPIAQYREGAGLKGLLAAFQTALRNLPKSAKK